MKASTIQIERKMERVSQPSPSATSIPCRNFKLKARTTKPSTIFTEFIQPPDFGNLLSHDGKIAKSVNGNEKPSEKANIPSTGLTAAPEAASTSNVPTIGPTHDRLTITVVSAKKKVPRKPPLSTCESVLLEILLGKRSSNRPKNAAAKNAKRRKKMVLVIQCVVRSVIKSAPILVSETSKPSNVYMAIMLKPKKNAFRSALRLFFFPRKKVTVMGIIGNTQGVRSPTKPATKHSTKKSNKLSSLLPELAAGVATSFAGSDAAATVCVDAAPLPGISNVRSASP